jgi:hypothetical protein
VEADRKTRTNPWLASGLHVALQIQKHYQSREKNKGNTFLIFDDNKREAESLTELIWSPPDWTDTFYSRRKRQDQLDQIIDTTFSIRSHHAGLVQVADLYAFIFCRYAELLEYKSAEEWKGERNLVETYVHQLVPRLLPRSARWPRRAGGCVCAEFFNAVAPRSLMEIGD